MKERIPIPERLLRHSRPDENGCWLWTGGLDKNGYGKATLAINGDWGHRRYVRAHRLAYETFVGPIPAGLELDHLCGNRGCINPAHLEPVTGHENILRGAGPAAVNARKTICKNGHLFTEENTIRYSYKGRGWRACRECRRRSGRESKRRLRAKGAACAVVSTPGPTPPACAD